MAMIREGRALVAALMLCLSALMAASCLQASAAGVSVGQARSYMSQGRYPEAVKALEALTRLSPANAELHLLLGQSLAKLKKYERSRDELRLAMRLGKGSSVSQSANREILRLPAGLLAPVSGDRSRYITAALQLVFLKRGVEVGEGSKPVIMEFYASWAQPCKQMKPVIERAKSEYGDRINFVSINVDDPANEKVVDQYGISPVPTLIFIDPGGEVVSYAIGFSGESSLASGIKKIVKG